MSAVAIYTKLEEILGMLTDPASGCETLSPGFCRVAVYPGQEVPWDACGDKCGDKDGMIYANMLSLDVTQEGPCTHIAWTAEIGVLRCAAPMADDGSVPDPTAIEADALQQVDDSDVVRRLFTCCPEARDRLESIVLVNWRAEGPQGGCVGGVWLIRGVLDDCC